MEDTMKNMMQGSPGGADPGMKGKGKKGKGKGKGKKGKGKSNSIIPAFAEGGAQMVTDNRVHNAGIHTVEIYYPQFYLVQTELEEYDCRPDRYGPGVIGKYTKGIGQVEARFPTDDEDIISYAMTTVHRLIERMSAKGVNETARYANDGKTLPWWNAIGRLDVGTESIVDRSKSVKSYCMDMFERYAEGEYGDSNIEGVDMYNACYGGQAAGLAVLNWVESDRWDGRYGISIATDVSDVPHIALFVVGAGCAGTLFFPDAPMSHHGVRASCIMHRFDFCKPVGWHHMGPVTDGKYSVECYMSAVDIAYQALFKKMNNKCVLDQTDYNVFHTGGGFHIVKKAFDRLMRADKPGLKAAEKEELTRTKLMPSVNLLKIVGPCHTVSSFMNLSSVAMQEWDRALGKILLVYTYGSGMASSYYQLRFDDVPYYDPLPVWRMKFYEEAIRTHPSQYIHGPYVECWMKFDYFPFGRQEYGLDLATTLQDDVYYLMEIDNFGRRFYCRGGLKGKPLPKEHRVEADIAEARHLREHYPALAPANYVEDPNFKVMKIEAAKKKAIATDQESVWTKLEYEMTFDGEDLDDFEEIGLYRDRWNPDKVTEFIKSTGEKKATTSYPDGMQHTYQILGSWNRNVPEDMKDLGNNSWTFEMTMGSTRMEYFYIIQDNDPTKKIYPYMAKAYKGMPVIGPHKSDTSNSWWIDVRDRAYVNEQDKGMPGDKYLITFSWTNLKNLTWEKTGQRGVPKPSQYYIVGSWSDLEFLEMVPDPERGDGWYVSPEAQMSSLGLEFQIVRNMDMTQKIHPAGSSMLVSSPYAAVAGPDDEEDSKWSIQDSNMGSVYKVYFYRASDEVEEWSMRVDWEVVGERTAQEFEPAYYIVGDFNRWGKDGYEKMEPLQSQSNVFVGPVSIRYNKDQDVENGLTNIEPFQILMHKRWDRCIYPDQRNATQTKMHKVLKGVQEEPGRLSFCIGLADNDQAVKGDIFNVQLMVRDNGKLEVSWAKSRLTAIMAGGEEE